MSRKSAKTLYVLTLQVSWAHTVQLRHLAHGMTGFSGDETYIAGGIFPRHDLYHGSAESTLLFLEGARRMLEFEEGRGLLSEEERSAIAGGMEEAARLYRENFVVDGVLYGKEIRFGLTEGRELTELMEKAYIAHNEKREVAF